MNLNDLKDRLFKAFNTSFEIFSLEYRYMYSAVLEESLNEEYFDNMINTSNAMSTKVYFYILKTIIMHLEKDERLKVIEVVTQSYSDEKREKLEKIITDALDMSEQKIDESTDLSVSAYDFLKDQVTISYNIINTAISGFADIIKCLDGELFKKIIMHLLTHKVDTDLLFDSYIDSIPILFNGADVTDSIKNDKMKCAEALLYAQTVGDLLLEAKIEKLLKNI